MAGEEWARRIISVELSRQVVLHDDGSSPGMYDLRVGPPESPEIAIECVGAVDQISTETWNIGPAKGPLELPIAGNWMIEIEPDARIKTIKNEVYSLLEQLETMYLREGKALFRPGYCGPMLNQQMSAMGIRSADRLDGSGGKVYMTVPGRGGAMNTSGEALVIWVNDFLTDPRREDVLEKLERSKAPDRHVFVIVTWSGAPWNVESYLTGALRTVPPEPPTLPQPVNGVWIVHALGSENHRGIWWDGNAWRIFRAKGEGIEGHVTT